MRKRGRGTVATRPHRKCHCLKQPLVAGEDAGRREVGGVAPEGGSSAEPSEVDWEFR